MFALPGLYPGRSTEEQTHHARLRTPDLRRLSNSPAPSRIVSAMAVQATVGETAGAGGAAGAG
ncbi:MAG TPA: hypothetical protein VGJ22_03040, partial [Anaerolineales bacterium]